MKNENGHDLTKEEIAKAKDYDFSVMSVVPYFYSL